MSGDCGSFDVQSDRKLMDTTSLLSFFNSAKYGVYYADFSIVHSSHSLWELRAFMRGALLQGNMGLWESSWMVPCSKGPWKHGSRRVSCLAPVSETVPSCIVPCSNSRLRQSVGVGSLHTWWLASTAMGVFMRSALL
jgi:hypothetical protein